jgi:hypothetical protein
VVRLVPGGGELEEARTLRARVMKCLGRSEIWGLSQISNRLSMFKPFKKKKIVFISLRELPFEDTPNV